MSGFAFPLHTSDERMSTAPPAYQPTWAQGPMRRTRPSSPAGPRAHRPRPISSPPPAHALSHPSLTAPNMTPLNNPSSPSHARNFYGGPCVPPAAAYIEQPNQFALSGQTHLHEHSNGFMVPLGSIAPSPLSGTLPPVSAPRISNATFQRTIDDIAGRMNVLNAAFARAQIQARADAVQDRARLRTLPMLGQYPAPTEAGAEKELAHVHEAMSGGDKENASIEQGSSGRKRPSTSLLAEEGQVLGFGKANGSGVLRKEIGNIAIPPEAVTRIKKDRRSKRKSSPFSAIPVPIHPIITFPPPPRQRRHWTFTIRHLATTVVRPSLAPQNRCLSPPPSAKSKAGSRVSSTGAHTPSPSARATASRQHAQRHAASSRRSSFPTHRPTAHCVRVSRTRTTPPRATCCRRPCASASSLLSPAAVAPAAVAR